ncbi:unnamed protein product, partial [Mesorhabditis belari]|uniref:TFIIS N-terminal domain-containing protein n=1 Tax=Mesorhabditis belari TaxID=2138241 RepID=A0AAF3EDT5_9BILA
MELDTPKSPAKNERIVLRLSLGHHNPPVEETPNNDQEKEMAMIAPIKLRINLTKMNESIVVEENLEPGEVKQQFEDEVEQELENNAEKQLKVESLAENTNDRDFLPDMSDDDKPSKSTENNNCAWDFDLMMERKKKERARRRFFPTCEVINDNDDKIVKLVDAMKLAAQNDRQSYEMKVPALKKLKLLPKVKEMLLKSELFDALIDNGMIAVLADWMSLLPDNTLPSLDIRTTILKLLQQYDLEQETLRCSGMGKEVMAISKHPKESAENKRLAQKLIHKWARPIFGLPTSYASLTRDERRQIDYDHMMAIQKRGEKRLAEEPHFDDSELKQDTEELHLRARVPKISHTTYFIRPKSGYDKEKTEEEDDEVEIPPSRMIKQSSALSFRKRSLKKGSYLRSPSFH